MAISKEQIFKARYHWADLAKLVGIFGVVYIHNSGYLNSYFRFAVPVFITISFFLIERSILMKKTFKVKDFLRKRPSRLAVPYLLWSCVYLFFNYQSTSKSILKFFSVHWIGFGWSGQYYLVVLASLTLLYPLFRMARVNLISLTIILAITLVFYIFFSYLSISKLVSKLHGLPLMYWIFYVYLGIYAARNYEKLQHNLQRVSFFYRYILLLALPLVMVIENAFLQGSGSARESYFRISTILVSTLVFLLFLSLEDCLIRKEANKFNIVVNWLGSYTLGIYCLNPLVIRMAQHFQFISSNNHPLFFIELILSISNCSIIYLICLFISILIGQLKGTILVK